jgi:hypothetical protein
MTKDEKLQEWYGRMDRLTQDLCRCLVDGGEDRYMHSGPDGLVIVITGEFHRKEFFPIANAMMDRWAELEELEENLKEEERAARAPALQVISGDASEKKQDDKK